MNNHNYLYQLKNLSSIKVFLLIFRLIKKANMKLKIFSKIIAMKNA